MWPTVKPKAVCVPLYNFILVFFRTTFLLPYILKAVNHNRACSNFKLKTFGVVVKIALDRGLEFKRSFGAYVMFFFANVFYVF